MPHSKYLHSAHICFFENMSLFVRLLVLQNVCLFPNLYFSSFLAKPYYQKCVHRSWNMVGGFVKNTVNTQVTSWFLRNSLIFIFSWCFDNFSLMTVYPSPPAPPPPPSHPPAAADAAPPAPPPRSDSNREDGTHDQEMYGEPECGEGGDICIDIYIHIP